MITGAVKLTERQSCIYTITNKLDGKIYVGNTSNFKKRKRTHINFLRKGTHPNSHLQNAWNLYSEDSFEIEVLELVDSTFLNSQESYWANILNSTNRQFGYNIKLMHPDAKCIVSEESRHKMKRRKTEDEKRRMRENLGRSVVVLDLNNGYVSTFSSLAEASIFTGAQRGNVFSVLSNKAKSAKGYVFVYKDEYDSTVDYTITRDNGKYSQKAVELYNHKTGKCGTYSSVSELLKEGLFSPPSLYRMLKYKVNCKIYKCQYIKMEEL